MQPKKAVGGAPLPKNEHLLHRAAAAARARVGARRRRRAAPGLPAFAAIGRLDAGEGRLDVVAAACDGERSGAERGKKRSSS